MEVGMCMGPVGLEGLAGAAGLVKEIDLAGKLAKIFCEITQSCEGLDKVDAIIFILLTKIY